MPTTIGHVDSGEWRYRQADRDESTTGENSQNLWIDDPSNAWGASEWPPTSTEAAPRSGETGQPAPADADPDAWYRHPAGGEWGQPRHSAGEAPARPASSYSPPSTYGTPSEPPARPSTSYSTDSGSYGSSAYRGALATDDASRPARPRRRVIDEEEPAGRRGRPVGELLPVAQVVKYTAAWFAGPAVLYLIWLVTIHGERQATVGRALISSLPWLFAAVVLSFAVAAGLRVIAIGWRALSLSFAAAVIGAGIITIAHSAFQ